MKKILLFPFTLLSFLFGRFSWAAPAWLSALNRFRQRRAGIFWGFIVVAIAATAGYQYYQLLPKPITVMADITAPSLTSDAKNAKPNPLMIEFLYDVSLLAPGQQAPSGYPSVARIDLVGSDLPEGITLSPAKKGTWTWISDRRLRFVPETDWPAGVKYTVAFDSSIFTERTKLSLSEFTFSSAPFDVDVAEIKFYQDPTELSIRRVVSTLTFSHPVDKASFEKSVTMGMRPSDSSKNVALAPYTFDIAYSDNLREAYIQSQPIELPNQTNYMTLQVDGKVNTILGGEPFDNKVTEKVLIPDIYSFLKVDNADRKSVV